MIYTWYMFGVLLLLFCSLTCFLQFTLDIFVYSMPSAREFVHRTYIPEDRPAKRILVCCAFGLRP